MYVYFTLYVPCIILKYVRIFHVICTVHHPTICMYISRYMHRPSSYNMYVYFTLYVPCIILQYVCIFHVICTVHHPKICMYISRYMHRPSSYNMYVYFTFYAPCIILKYVCIFHVLCTVHQLRIYIWTNKMYKILVSRLYFLLNALHVSDYIIPSLGATFYKLYIAYTGIGRYHTCGCCVAIYWI
jgi:hypothetical protein